MCLHGTQPAWDPAVVAVGGDELAPPAPETKRTFATPAAIVIAPFFVM